MAVEFESDPGVLIAKFVSDEENDPFELVIIYRFKKQKVHFICMHMEKGIVGRHMNI